MLLWCRWLTGVCLLFAAGLLPTAATRGSVKGDYGFLTRFDGVTEEEAREHVRQMRTEMGIMEFEFYNAFEGFSRPPDSGKEAWTCAGGGENVRRSVLAAYTEEIRRLGGRSWLTVQAQGTDPDDVEAQGGARVLAQHKVDGRALLDIVAPDAGWAERSAPAWADFAASLGFSGIHWATFGGGHDAGASGADLLGFLEAAKPLVGAKGLLQVAAFSDGYGFDRSLVEKGVVAFAYWVAWTLPEQENKFFDEAPKGSVFVCFAGKGADHEGERWNRFAKGIEPLDLLSARWRKARCQGHAYLAIGDGLRRATTDFLHESEALQEEEIERIKAQVFEDLRCSPDSKKPEPAVRHDAQAEAPLGKSVDNTSQQAGGCSGQRLKGDLYLSMEGVSPTAVGDLTRKHSKVLEEAISSARAFCEVKVTNSSELHCGGNGTVPIQILVSFEGTCRGQCSQFPVTSPEQLQQALQEGLSRAGSPARVGRAAAPLRAEARGFSTEWCSAAQQAGPAAAHTLPLAAPVAVAVVMLVLFGVVMTKIYRNHANGDKIACPTLCYEYTARRAPLVADAAGDKATKAEQPGASAISPAGTTTPWLEKETIAMRATRPATPPSASHAPREPGTTGAAISAFAALARGDSFDSQASNPAAAVSALARGSSFDSTQSQGRRPVNSRQRSVSAADVTRSWLGPDLP